MGSFDVNKGAKTHVQLAIVRTGKRQLCLSVCLSDLSVSVRIRSMWHASHCREPIVNRPSIALVSNLHFAPNR